MQSGSAFFNDVIGQSTRQHPAREKHSMATCPKEYVFFFLDALKSLLVPVVWDIDLSATISGQLVVPLFKL